jgi:hypothetical protein
VFVAQAPQTRANLVKSVAEHVNHRRIDPSFDGHQGQLREQRRRVAQAAETMANQGSAKVPTEKQAIDMDLPDIRFDQWTTKFGSGTAAKGLRRKTSETFRLFAEAVHMLNIYRKPPSKGDIWTSKLTRELKI